MSPYEIRSPLEIRTVGDPVLRTRAAEITDIDANLVKVVDDMFATMYDASGLGLAAPQVGISQRLFVYDVGDGPEALVNPTISESDGEWVYDEGCLSVPGFRFEIVRPKQVHVTGHDLDGNEVSFEADELLARLFQHELDHLNGMLLLEYLNDDQADDLRRHWRQTVIAAGLDPDEVDLSQALSGGVSG